MDADFSHDPQYLPAILAASKRYDLVIGSRYVPGGGVRDWPWHRQALSWGANTIAHLLLGLHARDCTAGFRCYRRQVLETVDPSSIRANGYSYLIEMLYCCERAGFTVGEVPIIFADRQLGQSKISQNEIFKAGRTVLRLAHPAAVGAQPPHGGACSLPVSPPGESDPWDGLLRPALTAPSPRAKEAQPCKRETRVPAPA